MVLSTIACIGRLHHQRAFFLVSACSPDGRLVPSRSQSYDEHFVLKGCVRGSILELFILAEGQRHTLLTSNLNDSLGNLQINGAGQLGYHGFLPDRDEASCLSRTFPIHGLDCAARHGLYLPPDIWSGAFGSVVTVAAPCTYHEHDAT
ncbi:hypothetical protein PAPYR_1621 [Paratrimastix pyriformis]|uniref:Uncharacterized protein n=1 Tax=Paratrimastix pyriformis TaxID=342808 RepID=A0ABQ8US08_9EUKA|nr:hypothetical protein PAPYR_1621 [Paratrimastix pyriformis]